MSADIARSSESESLPLAPKISGLNLDFSYVLVNVTDDENAFLKVFSINAPFKSIPAPFIFPPAGCIVWFGANLQLEQSKFSVIIALKFAREGSLISDAEVGV